MLRMIKEEENLYGFENIKIETDEGIFEISVQGDNLCWSLVYTGERLDIPDTYAFVIPDYNFLYSTFERLYNAVKENRPYSNGTYVNSIYPKEIYNEASYHRLFKDGKIEWHSDDLPYNEASVLTISKEEGCFKVEFKKGTDEWATHCVYFYECGESRYDPFNVAFENMYVELTKYEYINDKAVLSFFGKTEPNQHDKIREKKLYSIIRG